MDRSILNTLYLSLKLLTDSSVPGSNTVLLLKQELRMRNQVLLAILLFSKFLRQKLAKKKENIHSRKSSLNLLLHLVCILSRAVVLV